MKNDVLQKQIGGTMEFMMSKSLYTINAALALLVSLAMQTVAQVAPSTNTLSPVEKVKRAADEYQRLRKEIMQSTNIEERAALDKQAEAARAAQYEVLRELGAKAMEARRRGDEDEAERLRQLNKEAWEQTEFSRAMRESSRRWGVFITEVCNWPVKGESEWIEFENRSSVSVSLSGWRLTDGNNLEYRFPAELPEISPGARVVLYLDGQAVPTGRTEKATIGTNDNKNLVLHSPQSLAGNILGDRNGQCALYNDHSVVESFVAWGASSPGRVLDQAMRNGACARIDDAVETYYWGKGGKPVAPLVAGGTIIALPGGDGAKFPDYAVSEPEDSSPGAPNTIPAPLFRSSGSKKGETFYGFIGGDGALHLPQGFFSATRPVETNFEYHVFTDPECTRLLESNVVDSAHFQTNFQTKPVPKGSNIYLRVRLLDPDGKAGAWTKPICFKYDL